MPDSIVHTIDSISRVSVDSVLLKDSLARVDSVAHADSLRLALAQPTGIEGIAHPSIPATEYWVFIALVFLFLIFVFGIIPAVGQFYQHIKTLFSKKESVNLLQAPAVNIALLQVLTAVFGVGVIALLFYEILFTGEGEFGFKTFAVLSGITAAFYIAKHVLFDMVGYTFFNGKITKAYKNIYFGLLSMLTTLFFPALIFYTFQPAEWRQPLMITIVSLAGVFYVFLIIKLVQIFHTKILDLFYIFLYLCTLEILPLLVLFRACKMIV